MALYNVATVKRIDASYKTRMTRVDGIIFHIAVSNADFPHYLPGTKAHFYVRKDGTICQEIDTAFRSGANLEGNPFYLSVETEGGVGADVNNPWTPAQVESLALLAREAARIEGFPVRQMNSSRAGEQGIGWHRLGIDGNFPAFPNILAGRIQRGGGLKYSKSRGKVCPTDSRIVQIPRIIELAQDNAPAPTPEPEDTDMYENDKPLRDRLDQIVGWMDANFKAQNAAAENNRNLLAAWTRDQTKAAVNASTAAIIEAIPNLDSEALNAQVAEAVDKALDGKTIPVSGKIEVNIPDIPLSTS